MSNSVSNCSYDCNNFFIQASDHNNAGDYASAKSCGNVSLCCNVLVLVKYFLLILAAIALVAIYFTIGFGFITGGENPTLPPIHIPTCGYQKENCHFDSHFNWVCDEVYVCQ